MSALKNRLLCALVALVPSLALAAPPAAPKPLTVLIDKVGDVRIGMTVADAAKALQHELVVDGAFTVECHYVVPKPEITGLAFMVSQGRIVRIDVESSEIKTLSGITIGDGEARLRKAYGKSLEITQHKYGGKGDHYLTLYSRDRKQAIRFETFEDQITQFYTGLREFTERTDGCY